ncbi:MAG: hypothetical protein UH542_00505 [Bacteroidales bacterium]|nr:hypothetical protein [Bacteroidales bacterium]
MSWEEGPFRFMSFKEWVPDKYRFAIYIILLLFFQFSNGMYFSAMAQMQGDKSITLNDVKMFSHAVLIGLTMFFPLAFRLKFYLTNKTCLMIAAIILTICNIIVPFIEQPFILILIGFIAGFFRLFGTFECFSSMLPKITPTHNYATFLSFVFFIVLGVIHLFDVLCIQIIYYYDWKYIHLLAIGLMLIVLLIAHVCMQDFRAMPKMPLYGIDWLGMILWSIFILSLIFIFQYGNQLEWFESNYIRIATGATLLSLGFNLARMFHIRHPFIEPAAFKVRNLTNLLLTFLFLGILLASKNTLQNIFTGAVLHIDQLNTCKLKIAEFIGATIGSLFTWFALVRLKWSHKQLTFTGFVMIAIYVLSMYFLINLQTGIEQLYFPLICCSFGHLAIFISLTVYIQASAPFKNYFQVLCILGFVRTGIASPIGDAIYQHGLTNLTNIHLEQINSIIPIDALLSAIQQLYGYTFIFCISILIILATTRFKKDVKKPIVGIKYIYKLTKDKIIN